MMNPIFYLSDIEGPPVSGLCVEAPIREIEPCDGMRCYERPEDTPYRYWNDRAEISREEYISLSNQTFEAKNWDIRLKASGLFEFECFQLPCPANIPP